MATAVPDVAEFDVVVIGGGIMGSCSAYHCAKRGMRVLLLEQFNFLHRKGSSHGESRIIRREYAEDWYAEMVPRAYRLWEEASRESGYSPLTPTGSLDFGDKDSPEMKKLLLSCEKNSLPHDVLTRDELQERFPGFKYPEGTWGIHLKEGGVLHATKATAMFQMLAAKHGAVLKDKVRVDDLRLNTEKEGTLIVDSSAGTFAAKSCILACGAWTAHYAKAFADVDLPVEPQDVYVTYWRVHEGHQDALDATKGFPVFMNFRTPQEGHVYGMPIMDYPGLVKAALDKGIPCDPNNRPVERPRVIEPLQEWVKARFQGAVDPEPALVEACMYSMTPDKDFIIDLLPVPGEEERSASRVVVAAGFSGHGFKFGPLVGSVVADLVQHGSSSQVMLEKFSMKRFSGTAT